MTKVIGAPPRDTEQCDAQGRASPEPRAISDTDARLANMAVIRARHHLYLDGLT
ncbi:hypothetical protein ACFV06_13465 [Streptomyces sp. NPDC059618]|uniref:hypothetical protein n=1 Tax=Streptomyces sp. NPDC059618 TaxID=3346887 RepID=UPI003699565E